MDFLEKFVIFIETVAMTALVLILFALVVAAVKALFVW